MQQHRSDENDCKRHHALASVAAPKRFGRCIVSTSRAARLNAEAVGYGGASDASSISDGTDDDKLPRELMPITLGVFGTYNIHLHGVF